MPGGISVDLEVVGGATLVGGLQHPGTQRHDSLVCRGEVIDPQIEVHLLSRYPVGPVWRNVIWRELNPDAGFAIDHHHVPVILDFYSTAENPGPEAAFVREVRSVKHNDLMTDAHGRA